MSAHVPPAHYSAFGNISHDDCAWAAVANLVEERFPGATITTRNVLTAFNNDPNGTNGDDALAYLERVGFAGHRIASWSTGYQPDFKAALVSVVRSEGAAVAAMDWDGAGHMALVTSVNKGGITMISWGATYHESWSWWRHNGGAVFSVTW